MANSLIKGENCILEFYDGAIWKTFACGRSVTITAETEVIEKTVSEAGKNKHIVPTVNSFKLNFDGICALGDSNFFNIQTLRQLQLSHTLVRSRFTRTAMDGLSIYIDEVNFYITNSQDVASFDNIATFSIEAQGTGALTQTIINPPPTLIKVKRLDFTAAGGETTYTNILLINKDILAVHKDGIGNAAIITSGTPVNKEAKYTISTGEIQWAIEFEPNENAYVLYQDL
jgi:hypothetical protein